MAILKRSWYCKYIRYNRSLLPFWCYIVSRSTLRFVLAVLRWDICIHDSFLQVVFELLSIYFTIDNPASKARNRHAFEWHFLNTTFARWHYNDLQICSSTYQVLLYALCCTKRFCHPVFSASMAGGPLTIESRPNNSSVAVAPEDAAASPWCPWMRRLRDSSGTQLSRAGRPGGSKGPCLRSWFDEPARMKILGFTVVLDSNISFFPDWFGLLRNKGMKQQNIGSNKDRFHAEVYVFYTKRKLFAKKKGHDSSVLP